MPHFTVSFAGVIDSFRIDYRPGSGVDYLPGKGPKDPSGQFIRLGGLTFNAIPEPGSLVLFGSLLAGPAFMGRRRRQK